MELSSEALVQAKFEMAYFMLSAPLRLPLPPWHKKLIKAAKKDLPLLLDETYKMKVPRPHAVHLFNRYGCKKAVVTHGWMGSTEYMSAVIRSLVELDYCVVAIDIPCHGRSPGVFLRWQDSVNSILNAQETFGPFDLAVGHSYGGAMMLGSLGAKNIDNRIRGNLDVSKMVLLASPTSLRAGVQLAGTKLGLPDQMIHQLAIRLSRLPENEYQKLDGVYLQNHYPTNTEFLCIHDEKDPVVPFSNSKELMTLQNKVELVPTQNLGHLNIIYDDQVLSKIKHFAQN